jgi:hypothetical protein
MGIFYCCFKKDTIQEPLIGEKSKFPATKNISVPKMEEHLITPSGPQPTNFLEHLVVTQEIQSTNPVSDIVKCSEDEVSKFPDIYSSMCSSPTFAPASKNFFTSVIHLKESPLDLPPIVIREHRAYRNVFHKSFVVGKTGRVTKIFLENMTPIDERRVVNIQDVWLPELDYTSVVQEKCVSPLNELFNTIDLFADLPDFVDSYEDHIS